MKKEKKFFNKATANSGFREIWRGEGSIQEKYTQWNDKVIQIAERIFKTKRKKKTISKEIRIFRNKRKQLKKKSKQAEGGEKKMMIERRKILLQHICQTKQTQKKKKAMQVARKIKKEGGFDANAFWKYQEAIKGRKKEIATAMNRADGTKEKDKEKIKEMYREYYQQLLEDRKPENEEEERIERNRDKCIKIMEKVSEEKEIRPIQEEEYKHMKEELKKKKAPDQQGWRYEWVECAGKDLEESIKEMMNTMLEMKIQPKEWKEMRIKSIAKDSRKKMEMENRRGLFLTNILSKCMEKLLLNRRKEEIEGNITPFQCGGVKGRSICDNLFILNTVMDEYRERKENLYILFGDLEKCYDKLCLKDCIIELVEIGVPVEEAMYIYGMNRNIEAEVDTPLGKTEPINIKEVVRQGTIYGTTLWGISTDRINKMGRAEYVVYWRCRGKVPDFC